MGEILLLALLVGGLVEVATADSSNCVEGCSLLRLHGLAHSLQRGSTPLYFWAPETVDLWLDAPGITGFGYVGIDKIHKWHEITFTHEAAQGENCTSVPTLLPKKVCGSSSYMYLHSNRPGFWALNCPSTPCECPDMTIDKCKSSSETATRCGSHGMDAIRIPLDEASTWYWWPGYTDEIKLYFPQHVDHIAVTPNSYQMKQWNDFTIVQGTVSYNGTQKPTCSIVSRSLNIFATCTKEVNRDSDLFLKTFSGGRHMISYWAPKCLPRSPIVDIAQPAEENSKSTVETHSATGILLYVNLVMISACLIPGLISVCILARWSKERML
ncbi:uncharacterized protein LOC122246411 isoform X2 [Penaeus japonicus]|uniref:uncharacterized protein LOC122246411 isoform X2 n=1 Tax=Penaeus japonicus TaxID=27405 RepID=UPI001C716508|nr:uncharacterized protein LOC122246411 isoform X2 [Penaeus japonicus]